MTRKKSGRKQQRPRLTESAQAKMQDKVKRIIGAQPGTIETEPSPKRLEQGLSEAYAKNLEQIRRGRKWLFDRLSSSPQTLGVDIRQTKSGRPTLAVRAADADWRLMHSDQDPLSEAVRHVETIRLDQADYLLVLGFGLGYHVVEAMRRVPPGCPVFIIEQSPDVFKAALSVRDFSGMLSRQDVKIFVGTDLHETMPALQEDFKKFKYHNIKVVIHPPSAALFPSYREVMDNLYRILKIVQINVNTLRFFSRIWLKNNLLNLPTIVRSPGVKSLFGQFVNKPAILVSAGPSLDKNIDELRRAMGKAVILCADTSLRPLLSHGVTPNFVLAIDAQPITYRHFAGLDVSDVFLAGVTRLPLEVISAFGDRVFLASDLNNRIWRPIEPYFERLGVTGSGSTVAVLGFDLAREMGCDPIIFVGQDFSYSYGRAYAEGTMISNDMLSQLGTHATMDLLTEQRKVGEQIIRTKGIAGREPLLDIHGRPTEMSDAMQGWLTWFTLEIKRTKAKCINASEAGILADGVEVMPLDEAILTYCGESFDAGAWARSKISQKGKRQFGTVAEKLVPIRKSLEEVLARAESISSDQADAQAQLRWLHQIREEGQVCEVISGIIDWFKHRHKDEAAQDSLKLEAQATAFASRFAVKHILKAQELLKS